MTEQTWFHTLPMLRPARALDVLSELGADQAALAASGMRVLFRAADQVHFMLPPDSEVPRKLRATFEPARDRLFALLTSVANINFDPQGSPSAPRDTADLVDIPVAATALACLLAVPQARGDAYDENAGAQLFLVDGTAGQVARAQSSLLLRVRDLGAIIDTSAADGRIAAAFLGNDDVDAGAMPDGLDALLDAGGTLLRFRRWQFGRVAVHLPRKLHISDQLQSGLGQCLVHHQGAFSGRELAVHQDGDGHLIATWVAPDDATRAPELLPQDYPDGDAWTIRERVLTPGLDAQDKLNAIIGSDSFPVGYRIRLRRLRDTEYSADAVDALREEVDDLLVRIDLINAMVPQAGFDLLFRFTSRQLPALVDAMRRLPAERWRDGSVRYASGHPVGDENAPIHYVMCAPDVAGSLAAFPEVIHAQNLEATPMRYAVDPVWADYAASHEGTRAAVYVPAHHTLTPSLGAFGSSLEHTLRQVMGQKFRDIAGFVEDPARSPIFLISSLGTDTARLGIEVIDARDFVPLNLRINWLNDYLQLLPPQIVSKADLSSVATDVYKGTVADEIHARAVAAETSLATDWDRFRTQREQELDAFADTLGTELAAATDYAGRLMEHLRALDSRLSAMERMITAADTAMSKADARIEALADLPEDLAALRESLRVGLTEEVRRGEALTRAVTARVEKQREIYHALRRGDRL